VLIKAKMSNPLEIFLEKICVMDKTTIENIIKPSITNTPAPVVIIKNQKVSPAVTANDLNLGEEVCNYIG